MAKLAVMVTLAVIFSLFFLSHARIPLSQPSNLVTEYKPSTTSSESETNTVSIDDLQTSNADPKTLEAIGISHPLTVTYDVSFHPINRHFHHLHTINRPLLNRFPRGHRCRYHNGKRVMGPREGVSYGHDMIVSSESRGKGYYDQMDRSRNQYFVKPFDKHMRNYEVNDGEKLTKRNYEKMRHVFGDAYVEMKREEEGGLWNKVRKLVDGLF